MFLQNKIKYTTISLVEKEWPSIPGFKQTIIGKVLQMLLLLLLGISTNCCF